MSLSKTWKVIDEIRSVRLHVYTYGIVNFVIQQRGLTIQENGSTCRDTLKHFRPERDFRFGFGG